MALVRVPLMADAFSPDANAYWSLYSAVAGSAPTRDVGVWVFQDAVTGILKFSFAVPKNWVSGSTKLVLLWTSPTTAGNVVFNATHRAATASSTIMNTNTTPASRTDALTTSAKPGAADQLEVDTITITDTDWAVDRLIVTELSRLGADGSDTKAANAILFAALLEYADA